MDGKQIVEVREEEDLGIIIQNDVKWSKHCVMVSSSGNRILGKIRRTFVYKAKEVVVHLDSVVLCADVEATLEEGYQIA